MSSSQNPIEETPSPTSPEDQGSVVRLGEYARNGDFHRNLNPNWSYYPIYINKVEVVDELLRRFGHIRGKTLDAGCGEGVLVEKYYERGWDIVGVDKNYASVFVQQGSLTDLPFEAQRFDNALCLDALEHLTYTEQVLALQELKRVLTPGGMLLISIPNLAHFTSRLKMMFRGRFLRTASIDHHPGDRPAWEYQKLLQEAGFVVEKRVGIFPTIPPIYRFVMTNPAKSVGLLRFLRKLPIPPFWQFQVLFVCRSPGAS
jgi:predicted SAM-dependent methyltransferase